jgi:hypothetical protein
MCCQVRSRLRVHKHRRLRRRVRRSKRPCQRPQGAIDRFAKRRLFFAGRLTGAGIVGTNACCGVLPGANTREIRSLDSSRTSVDNPPSSEAVPRAHLLRGRRTVPQTPERRRFSTRTHSGRIVATRAEAAGAAFRDVSRGLRHGSPSPSLDLRPQTFTWRA